MKCNEVLQTIDKLYPYYLDVLEDVCNLESPTDDKRLVDAVGNYLIAFAKERGWKIETYPQERSGDVVCITLCGDVESAPICLSGHIDTVYPVGLWDTPAVRRDDVNMYGPGVMDCKGGVVAAMLAMEALMKCGFSKRPVHLLVQSDEENSSVSSNKATIRYICEKAKKAVAFLNLEGAEGDTAVLVRRGIWRSRFIVHGQACHSSELHKGANAIVEAAHKILRLEELNKIEGISCSCNLINGGTAINVVAEECTFCVDIRFPDDAKFDEAKNLLYHIKNENQNTKCTCDLEEISFRPAMVFSDRNEELLRRMNEIYENNGLPVLEGREEPSGSDAAYVTQCEIPCVDNLGTAGGNIHSLDEYIVLSSLAESAKRIAAVVCEI